MTHQLLIALGAFAFVSSITPGPNNLLLMSSGANYGFRRTVPHMLGVAIGFTVMLLGVGAGLVHIFSLFPVSYTILKVVSVAYLLWLAWKLATAAAPKIAAKGARPMTFLQAALFQWVNPKAWTMALTAFSAYAPGNSTMATLIVALVFGAVNLPCISVWVALGRTLRGALNRRPGLLTAFNVTMALLLVASLWPVLHGSVAAL